MLRPEARPGIAFCCPLLVLLLLLMGGCAEDGRGEGEAATQVGGIESRWELDDRILRWELREEGRIEESGSSEEWIPPLTVVRQVLIGPEGELYVAQTAEQVIRVFGSGGELLRTIGRPGQGPGEFSNRIRLGLRDDVLFVGDDRYHRVTFFSLEGEVLDVVSGWGAPTMRDPPITQSRSAPEVILSDGSGLTRPRLSSSASAASDPDLVLPRLYLRLHPGSDRIDTVAVVRNVRGPVPTISVQGREVLLGRPFPVAPLSALAPDGSGVVIVEPSRVPGDEPTYFTIRKLDPEGDTIFSRRHEFAPMTVTGSMMYLALEPIRRTFSSLDLDVSESAIRRELDRHGALPDVAPTVTDLRVGQDGTIWLQREREGGPLISWTVLDSHGAIIGQVRIPSNQRIVAARGSTVVALELDRLDVPSLVRYRIETVERE